MSFEQFWKRTRFVQTADGEDFALAAWNAATAAEREACAAMLDEKADEWGDPAEAHGLRLGAAEIRAR